MIDSEAKWQAKDDAYTLSQAEAIKSDPQRLEDARKAAKEMLEEKQKEMNGLKKITGQRITSRPQLNTSKPTQTNTVSNTTKRNNFNADLSIFGK
jgi:hypothetical protein